MAATKFDQTWSFQPISYFSESLVDFDDFSIFFLFLEGNVTISEVHDLFYGQVYIWKVKVKVKVKVILT